MREGMKKETSDSWAAHTVREGEEGVGAKTSRWKKVKPIAILLKNLFLFWKIIKYYKEKKFKIDT